MSAQWGSNLIHSFLPGQGFSTWTWPVGVAVSTGALGGCPGGLWHADPLLPPELLSAEDVSVSSPRLSPDGQRLLYLEGVVGGPHRQCLRLRMVSWASWAPGTAVPPRAASTVPSPGVTASLSLLPGLGWGIPKAPCLSFPWHGSIPEQWLSPAHLAYKADSDSARRSAGAHGG